MNEDFGITDTGPQTGTPCATSSVAGSRVAVEVRRQGGAIDEIIITGGSVHIEQMSADGWFMGVEAADGSYWQFWFGAKNRKSAVEFRHTETVTAAEQKTFAHSIEALKPTAHGLSVSKSETVMPNDFQIPTGSASNDNDLRSAKSP